MDITMKSRLLSSAVSAAILIAAGSAFAHDAKYHVAQNTELKQFGGNELPRAKPKSAEVPLWPNLLGHRFEVSTSSTEAQDYIDQAMMLTFGFNHAEAARSFRQAQEIDPSCAICFWGEALVLGPNINAPMDPAANAPALAALEKAKALAGTASPREQALIKALDSRYAADGDRAELDLAYADAMTAVAAQYPDDDDIAVLHAEALMDLSPWDFWADGGATPKGRTADIVATLERVLKRNPDHIGAIHLYIHTVEASTTPERAEPFADRLAGKDIGAGHLVHMPSHIYYRIGRYADSLEANRRAVATDETFFGKVAPEGLYAGGYYPHNIHFLLVSAQMAGDGPTAIEAAGKLSLAISDDLARVAPAFVQPIKAAPLFAHAQFSDSDTILAIERPSGDFPFIDAVWHYMRGVGQAAGGNVAAAQDELAALRDIAAAADLSAHKEGGMPAADILAIAALVLEARIAQTRDDWAEAARAFADAKAIEDGLAYMEPRHWYYPVGQSLGAALLHVGDLEGAEEAFKESLALAPNNGWSLFGLSEVYRARGDMAKAEVTARQWRDAWTGDTSLLRLERL
jgi:tetratricopeptide (TPR) repeat protein